MKLDSIFSETGFYGSQQIPRINYLMSFMALKLIGKERLSHVVGLNFDYGLGTFAGLNILPKGAAITQYSYRNPHQLVITLLKKCFIRRCRVSLNYLPKRNQRLTIEVS
ncbi:MAG: hypothetical protein A3G70_00080 [Planctomycetes bacterium RIFCSPLOWO2_12_FULL_39_13]|nr:MAG: hypothetical protein A3G70_00080 [Planctomycetes bacterium RIFCSPLOWO2_12_FULL_39_13]